jgi:hypothetical protein
MTYDYENDLRSLSYLHNLFRNTSGAILEDSQFPLITKNNHDVQCQHHCTVATLSRPMGIVKPTRWGERHSQAPLAGIDRSSQRQLVERMGYVHAESVVTLSPRPLALQPDLPWLPPDLRLHMQQQVPPSQP